MLRRLLHLSLSNLYRHKLLSLATISVISLMVCMLNIILAVNLLASSAIKNLNAKVDVITYLKDDSDYGEVNNLMQELKALPTVKEVVYTSKEEALQNLLKGYKTADDPFKKYGLENKLPANLRIVTYEPADHDKITSFLQAGKYAGLFLTINDNRENQTISQQLVQITNKAQKILWGIIVSYFIGSILITQNSLKLILYNRREEINIMYMVGAGYNFIYLPFVIEAIIYTALSAILGSLLFLFFFSGLKVPEFNLVFSEKQWFEVIGLEILGSAAIGISTSLWLVRKYVKEKII